VVQKSPGTPGGTIINNVATVGDMLIPDTNPANNTASTTTVAAAVPTLKRASSWALTMLLMGIGWSALRRRRASTVNRQF
jgi:hypothetical protein